MGEAVVICRRIFCAFVKCYEDTEYEMMSDLTNSLASICYFVLNLATE